MCFPFCILFRTDLATTDKPLQRMDDQGQFTVPLNCLCRRPASLKAKCARKKARRMAQRNTATGSAPTSSRTNAILEFFSTPTISVRIRSRFFSRISATWVKHTQLLSKYECAKEQCCGVCSHQPTYKRHTRVL